MTVRFQTSNISSTEGTKGRSIWKNQQPTTVFLHDANIGQRLDTTHATEAPPTIDLPSKKFGCSPMVSNPVSHVRLFSLAFFCSALTKTVLTRTVSSNRVHR